MKKQCPDCGASIGEPHEDGCDVAVCLHTGEQRYQCWQEDHDDCGQDIWKGQWPGIADCQRLGLWCVFVPFGVPSPWKPVPEDTPEATEDLNRIFTDCEWDPNTHRWELR